MEQKPEPQNIKILNSRKLKEFLIKRQQDNLEALKGVPGLIHPLAYQYQTAAKTFEEIFDWCASNETTLEV
jgi:hypothetical protein